MLLHLSVSHSVHGWRGWYPSMHFGLGCRKGDVDKGLFTWVCEWGLVDCKVIRIIIRTNL